MVALKEKMDETTTEKEQKESNSKKKTSKGSLVGYFVEVTETNEEKKSGGFVMGKDFDEKSSYVVLTVAEDAEDAGHDEVEARHDKHEKFLPEAGAAAIGGNSNGSTY